MKRRSVIGIIAGSSVAVVGGCVPMSFVVLAGIMGGAQQQQAAIADSPCAVTWEGDGVPERSLTQPQLDAAATIYKVAMQAGVGIPGAVIGIATALQESDLGIGPGTMHPNSDGDMGLFQMRVYYGWHADGRTEDDNITILSDHAYQANVFFLGHDTLKGWHIPGLVDIKGWETMPLTEAAQKVQVSAFPSAYAKHEPLARALVTKLAGGAMGAPVCGPGSGLGDCPTSGMASEAGLSADALRALRCIKQKWPQITTIGGKRYDPGSDHHDGKAIDVMIPNWMTTQGSRLGTEIATWVQENAIALGVTYVIYQQKLWSTARANEGWRVCGVGASCYDGADPTAAHFDHVHISVHGNAGTGLSTPPPSGASLPVAAGTYRLTARFHQSGKMWSSGFHTGLDFAAPTGSPLLAVGDGTITFTGWHNAYGHLTKLSCDGAELWYAHQSAVSVAPGQTVTAGQPIGRLGGTGNVTGPHLHLEVRVGGRTIDPDAWLTMRGARP